MQLRLSILAIGITAAACGCATPEQPTAAAPAATAEVGAPKPQDRYVTGSRLPVRDDSGAGSVTAGSKRAWEDEMRRSNSGTHDK
ncbi:MAG TPA: hypothetical protein VE258_16720 [Ktedonobacterales bacterium]|nr:hypothetical protein [Ktedonobacterales bacterium]